MNTYSHTAFRWRQMYQFILLFGMALGAFSTTAVAQAITADKAALDATRNLHNGNVLLDYSTPAPQTVSVFMQRDSTSIIHFVKDKEIERGVYSLEVNKNLLPGNTTQFYYTLGKDTIRVEYVDE